MERRNRFNVYINNIIDSVFPHYCAGCLREGSVLCASCFQKIHILKKSHCDLCDQAYPCGSLCVFCQQKSYIDQLYYVTEYDELMKRLLNAWKKQYIVSVESMMAFCLRKYLEMNMISFPQQSCITYIPLHARTQRMRGFNQSQKLAQIVSEHLNISLTQLLSKTKAGLEQGSLKKELRYANVEHTIKVVDTPEKTVILVDDVYDSGITLNYAAQCLKESGCEKVIGFVFARAKKV